jgi:hypothetical protein
MVITTVIPTTRVELEDGFGFRTVVRSPSGEHFLVSEIHRGEDWRRLDETMVFPCTDTGEITSYTEVTSGDVTEDAIRNLNSHVLLN